MSTATSLDAEILEVFWTPDGVPAGWHRYPDEHGLERWESQELPGYVLEVYPPPSPVTWSRVFWQRRRVYGGPVIAWDVAATRTAAFEAVLPDKA